VLAEAKFIAVTGDMPPAPEPTAPEKPVPTPEKPQPDTPDSAQTGTTEDRIRAAVRNLAAESGGWVRLAALRQELGDVDQEEVTRVLTDLARNDPDVTLAPQANRKALTEDDHAATVPLGMGEQAHILAIQPPSIDGAADHVQAVGVANASDEELENGLHAPEVRSALYDEIRTEQKRRKQRVVTSPPSPAPTPDPRTGTTEERIRAAVRSLGRAGRFVGIKDVRRAVGDDVSHEDVTAAMREMERTDPNVVLSPDSNRRGLKQEDHDAAIKRGREYAHLIAIQHPSIPGEAERVRAAGLANATDEQLEIARQDPDITSALYDEIRGEEKRRKQQ
jgi:hypothetical protein